MTTEERILRSHLALGPFLLGVARGHWRMLSITWPYAIFAVSAAERRSKPSPREFSFRFELTGYPVEPPTAQPWDNDAGGPLVQLLWPTGNQRVATAFRPDWLAGQALYLPIDRLSIAGHDNWKQEFPGMIWTPQDDLTKYLEVLHDLLNSPGYSGVRGS